MSFPRYTRKCTILAAHFDCLRQITCGLLHGESVCVCVCDFCGDERKMRGFRGGIVVFMGGILRIRWRRVVGAVGDYKCM